MAETAYSKAIEAWQNFSDSFSGLSLEDIQTQVANRFLVQTERIVEASEADLFDEMIYESVIYFGMQKALKAWNKEIYEKLDLIFTLGDRWAKSVLGSAKNYNILGQAFRIGAQKVKDIELGKKKKDAEKVFDRKFGFQFAGVGLMVIKSIYTDIKRIEKK